MKKKSIKLFAVIILACILVHIVSNFNVSNAAQTMQGSIDLNWSDNDYGHTPGDTRLEILKRYPNRDIVDKVKIISTTKLYRYTYYLVTKTYNTKTETITYKKGDPQDLIRVQKMYDNYKKKHLYLNKYPIESVIWMKEKGGFVIRYKIPKDGKKIQKSTDWTTNSSFSSVVGTSTAAEAKDVSVKVKYRTRYTIIFKDSAKDSTGDSNKPSTDDVTDNPSTPSNDTSPSNNPSNDQGGKNTVIDNNQNQKQTETIDNGTALQNAIDFVNQVFDIKEANKYNQAVKDLVSKTKTAIDITAAELTNINANDSLSTEDFSKQAYKRALGRDANEEELKDITDNNYTFSDIISKLVSSDEFKEICNKYNLEVGSYVPVVFNQGTTQEKSTNFVKHEFSIIMGREPTEAELNAIVPNLVNGKINASIVVSAIFESSEFKNKELDDAQFIKTLVKATTNQDINEKVTSEYTQRLSSGTSRNDLIQELLRHSKFQSLCSEYSLTLGSYSPRAITPTQELADKFNTQVSKSILGSNANVIQSLSSYLTSGKYSAGDFIRLYVESDNFAERVKTENMSDADYVMSLFKATLQREPTSEELTEYLSKINQNNKSSILTEMLNTGEFASVCNKYYLPVVKYEQTAGNGEKRETIEDKSKGAIITKIKNTDTTGKTTEIIDSVKFDVSKGVKGDVNGDGEVNSSDASLVLIYSAVSGVKFVKPSQEELSYADINGDGAINASDAALILIYSAKKNASADGNVSWDEIVK